MMPKVADSLSSRREVLPLPAATLVSAAGYMLEHPAHPSGTRHAISMAVTIRWRVARQGPRRTISRKPYSRDPQRPYASLLEHREDEMVRPLWRRREADPGPLCADCATANSHQVTAKSEIPCRVSSDLHEWRNDLGTVSTGDSAKLQYE